MNHVNTTLAEADTEQHRYSAGTVPSPSFLMCPPFSHAVDVANNIWMTEASEAERRVDPRTSLLQFTNLYHFLAAEGMVYLLPSPAQSGLQDQVYAANLAFVPEHLPGRDTAIVARFTSAPRLGETAHGMLFFEAMGYDTIVAPFRFEGEAEIKHLHDNIYIGGYGERSDPQVYDWMESRFDMKIIKVEERNPYFYHLDCSVFPLSREETILCSKLFTPEEIKAIERETEIIDISEEVAFNGLCNSVRLNNIILNGSNLHDLKAGSDYYHDEITKNRALEDICAARGYEPAFFNLSEHMKSGALLSCMVMHLNRDSYAVRLF
jgi:N-dimethylarginine dimethylaminohydrolase